MPRIVSYTVGAIFEIGVYDYDKAYVVMPMQDAQTLLMLGDSVGMIEVQTVDADQVGQILAPLADKVAGRAIIADWRHDERAIVRGAGDRAGDDVLRAVHHHPRWPRSTSPRR